MFLSRPPSVNRTYQFVAQEVVEENLDDFLPSEQDLDREADDVIDLAIARLLNRLYSRHSDCLWLDGATLCSPEGKTVILAGASYSGKTTLALGLALSSGWKLLSEDITLFDTAKGMVLSCPAPCRIRTAAVSRLQSLDKMPPGITDGWFFDTRIFDCGAISAKFELAIVLDPYEPGAPNTVPSKTLSATPVAPDAFVRALLPISNALRHPGGIEFLHNVLCGTACLLLTGGELLERIDLLNSRLQQFSAGRLTTASGKDL